MELYVDITKVKECFTMNQNSGFTDTPVMKLRPHHGMCLYFFEGKGYSEGFVANMQRVKDVLATNPKVHLTVQTDSICMACPNNIDGICQSAAQVEKYDRAVLSCCGLEEGQELPFFSFSRLIKEKIFDKDRREEICGRCQWSDICQR
jgi:hypothetical protein